MGTVIYHYQRSTSELHISSDKNTKASQFVFCDKINHKSQFCKTVTNIDKEILKKKTALYIKNNMS